MPLQALVARNGQFPLLELLLDELPTADGLLAIDRGDAAFVHRNVGQLEFAGAVDGLDDLGGRGRADEHVEHMADGLGAGELGVGQAVASELEDALGDLQAGVVLVKLNSAR